MIDSAHSLGSAQPTPASLLQDNAFLRRLLAASPDCIKVLDLDANLLAMSENGQKALELEDVTPHLGTCWTGWWQGPTRSLAEAAVAAARAGGTGRFEASAETFGGTLKTWDVTVTAIPGPDGRPERLLSISRDVTDRREARDQAADRLDRLQSIVLGVKDYAVVSVDLNGRIDGWSTGAVDTFGWPESFAIGQRFDLIWSPEDILAGSPGRELEVVKRHGKCPDNRFHVRADGQRIYVVGACRPIHDAAGTLTGFVKVCRDETGRHRADNALTDARRRLDAALQGGQIATWVWELSADRMYADRNLFAMFGLPPDGGVGLPVAAYADTLHPEDRPVVMAALQRAIETGEDYVAEYRVITFDPPRWVAARGMVEKDDAGRPVRLAGVVQDVTDRKSAEAQRDRDARELAQTEARLRQTLAAVEAERANLAAVVESAPAFVCVLRGPTHVFELANERYYELVSRRDLLGRAAREALPEVEGQGFFELLDHVYATGEPFTGHEVPIDLSSGPGGQLRRLRIDFVYQALRGADGVVDGVFVHGVDVTASVDARDAIATSDRQRRMALDTADLGSFNIDPRTATLACDERFRVIFGLSTDHCSYEEAFAVVHPDDRDTIRNAVAANVRPVDPVPYAAEYRVVHADGTVRWVAAKGRTTFQGQETDRQAVSFDGTIADITERKAAEVEREQLLASEQAARSEAELAGRMKDEFLATLSHELRTPLNAIVGWTQILSGPGNSAADYTEGLSVISRNARAQTQIIEDILDMSRIISGKLRLDVQRIDLAQLVKTGADTVRPAADAKGVRLQVLVDPAAGPITGDPSRLHQVLWNLLSNAVKFTPKGGRVQLVLERINSHIEVAVTDTGEGIEPDFLPHVFDRFRQADGSTTRRHGGLGLGLAIVKQLVELHGGSVAVNSPGKGQGATFTVALPLSILHAESADSPLPREHPTSDVGDTVYQAACDQLQGLSILVVDDEADARAMIKLQLERCGANVRTAGSAEEAMTSIKSRKPDLLVSDIGMPNADGYALIHRVRSLPAAVAGLVPAIALTAYARSADRVKAMNAGFQMHLAKPVEAAELVAAVATLANVPRQAVKS